MKNTAINGKIPPQAHELEESILSSVLIDNTAMGKIDSILSAEVFYDNIHATVYSACEKLYIKGHNIDILTVSEQLKKMGKLESVGGILFINELSNIVASSANIEEHAMILYEKYMLREAIRISNELLNKAYECFLDPFELIEKSSQNLSKVVERIRCSNIKHASEIYTEVVTEMYENKHKNGDMLGLPSGLRKIDNITMGFTSPDLIIIAGGAGEGKTTLALQIAQNVAKTSNVAIFSLEMSSKQILWKILSSKVKAPVSAIRKGSLSDSQWKKIELEVYNEIEGSNLYISDIGGMSIFDLKSACRSMKKNQGLDMVVIDYIQLLNAQGGEMKFGVREQEINYISKQLKSLAKELEIPIIALSQLSRIERGSKRLYRLSDLRESGAIEQDADGVMFVFRPSYHDILNMSINGVDTNFNEGDTIVQFAKWRLGDTGIVQLYFDGKNSVFLDENPDGGYILPKKEFIISEEDVPF